MEEEDEQMRLGAQQAAIIQMQQQDTVPGLEPSPPDTFSLQQTPVHDQPGEIRPHGAMVSVPEPGLNPMGQMPQMPPMSIGGPPPPPMPAMAVDTPSQGLVVGNAALETSTPSHGPPHMPEQGNVSSGIMGIVQRSPMESAVLPGMALPPRIDPPQRQIPAPPIIPPQQSGPASAPSQSAPPTGGLPPQGGPPVSAIPGGPPQPPGLESAGNLLPPGVMASMSRPLGPPGESPQSDNSVPRPPPGEGSAEGDDSQDNEMRLPQALEKMLAYKDMRAQEVGVSPDEMERVERGEVVGDADDVEEEGEIVADDEETLESSERSKEVKGKKKKKKKKKGRRAKLMGEVKDEPASVPAADEDLEIEYVQEEFSIYEPGYAEFAKVFDAFKISEQPKPASDAAGSGTAAGLAGSAALKSELLTKAKNVMNLAVGEDDDEEEEDKKESEEKPKLSKKKMKKLNRLSVAELKQLVSRPDVVEMHDVTAQDPKLLIALKATKNTVAVPRHWCFKRKYLQGKRGIEKPPFELPGFIKDTGIMEMRQALQDKEDQKTLKSKMRERVRPKMGKIDIDYQKLHDAFFKWQTKPKMSIHGDLYYEGKEFETRLKEKKPGNLSDDLRTALGMPIGPNAEKYPPPWLIAMQRYGPPPSYPNLKIPGLNAPIPDGCAFGYHAGGWGKPPVDETGKPLYGDVFGTQAAEFQTPGITEEHIDKSYWGELESESSEEESSEEEEEEEEEDKSGLVTPADTGLVTPSGVTSVPLGMETPDMIELRKRRIEHEMDQGGDTPALYTVLPEKKQTVGGAMMGSAHVYDMTGVAAAAAAPKKTTTGEKSGVAEGIDVALNPEELDLDSAAMQAKYEQTMREQQSQLQKEDLSDMVAEHAAKQKKRKKQQDTGKSSKKYKEFKF